MNPTQRRKSTLGRRNRNGEKPKKISVCPARLPLVTPGMGRFGSGENLKASNDFMARKQLFSTYSSGKKTQFGSSSRKTYTCSPNDSQGSYQSDSSLNLTAGVQRIPSPDYKSTTTNLNAMKSYQGYKNIIPSISVETPSFIKPKKWDAMSLEPPPSPPPSRFDRLIQLELACIKPPVDPDDLKNLENLTLDDKSDSNRTYFKPITSTVAKEVEVLKFSPDLSSTHLNSTLNIVIPDKPVSRSLDFDQSDFRKPLEVSKSNSSTIKYCDTRKGLSKNLDSARSCDLNHILNISNAFQTTNHNFSFNAVDTDDTLTTKEDSNILVSPKKHVGSDKKLSIINEVVEKDFSSEDLNSTHSFLMAEQTIIDQDQYLTCLQTVNNTSKSAVNNKRSLPEVTKTSGSDDEVAQAIGKVDAILNKMAKMKKEMCELENEMKSVLQQLKVKQSKSKIKEIQNKENIPNTTTKDTNNKWFKEMKSEYPNLLKTPNPARQSVSRMSLVNQSIMTPHSFSIVINDQIEDLFN